MKCRFCGEELIPTAGQLRCKKWMKCPSSPDKRHVGLPDNKNCIYCGEEIQSVAGKLRTKRSHLCYGSPDKKHYYI